MLHLFMCHIDCLAIIALGFWLGYMFVWGLANLNVSANGFVTMAAFIFTGPVIEFIGHMHCATGTAFYILSGVTGGILYLILVTVFKVKQPTKNDNPNSAPKPSPVFPWLHS